jgi:oligopeptide transport system permease protein
LFGTDGVGRDIWARVWFGTRTSFLLSIAVAVFQVGLGVVIGALWGFYRKLDTVMFAIYNTLTNVPSTIYLVLIAYIMKPSILTIIIALVATGWISEARWFRSRILALREVDYNIASICLKTPTRRIISKNVIPHLVSLIIMDAALTIPSSIGSEVFLSFIGVGLPPETCTLGNLVNQGRSAFLVYPFQMICPTVLLCFITISFYIIGNKFADASDPKNHL